ncbi:MAG: ABC transporter permease [Methanobacteriota archaeon]|nr:MAG: ABC transporter permease [Euryarchaeota archaeon]
MEGVESARLIYYVMRRLLILIPTLLGVTVITFFLSHAPGPGFALAVYCSPKLGPCTIDNPLLKPIVDQYHLRDPIPIQYVYYLSGLLQGDWGFTSSPVSGGIPVTQAITLFLPQTVELAVASIVLATLIGIPMGTVSALRKDRISDHATRIFALVGYSIPFFWLALLLQIAAISLNPEWEITGGYSPTVLDPGSPASSWAFVDVGGTPVLFSQPTHFLLLDAALHGSGTVFIDALKHLLLPTITLTIGILGVILRMIRSGMVDSMNQDYVKTAWSKGLPDWVVTRVHIRRNALLPAVTVIGLLFAGLLGGVVLVEYVFAWKGIGYWATQAVLRFDTGGVMGTTLIFAIFLVVINLVADVIYAYLDPRITL